MMETHDRLYDVVVIGAGPAGLSAAIYAARAKYKVLVLEKDKIGGQITITSEIVNYPGVELSGGRELTEHMRVQAEGFGAEFAIAEVLDMELDKDRKLLHTTKGDYEALGVILAPGANPRKLGFKGEKEFQGRGVFHREGCLCHRRRFCGSGGGHVPYEICQKGHDDCAGARLHMCENRIGQIKGIWQYRDHFRDGDS